MASFFTHLENKTLNPPFGQLTIGGLFPLFHLLDNTAMYLIDKVIDSSDILLDCYQAILLHLLNPYYVHYSICRRILELEIAIRIYLLYVSQPYMKVNMSLVKKLKIRSLRHSSDLLYQKNLQEGSLIFLISKSFLGDSIRQFWNRFFSLMSSF